MPIDSDNDIQEITQFMYFPTDITKWKGKNTYHPDCSNPNPSLWGFDTFNRGTVGMAVLDWFINTWEELDCPEQDLATTVFEELNFYINNKRIAKALRDAWLQDYTQFLAMGIMAQEEAIIEWLQKTIRPFIN